MKDKKFLLTSLVILLLTLTIILFGAYGLFKIAFEKQLFKHDYYIKGVVLQTLEEEADREISEDDEQILPQGPLIYYPYESQMYTLEARDTKQRK